VREAAGETWLRFLAGGAGRTASRPLVAALPPVGLPPCAPSGRSGCPQRSLVRWCPGTDSCRRDRGRCPWGAEMVSNGWCGGCVRGCGRRA